VLIIVIGARAGTICPLARTAGFAHEEQGLPMRYGRVEHGTLVVGIDGQENRLVTEGRTPSVC
jgi:hypothetical protein